MMIRRLLGLALALPMAACSMMGMPHEGMGFEEGQSQLMQHAVKHWPTVRIDGIDGARVTMKRGVFGDGLDVRTPFQAEFQPTGTHTLSGYPLEIDLDERLSKRFGSNEPIRLRASLMVPEHMTRHGILRIDVNECELRALIAGDLDAVTIHAEELPTAELACHPKKLREEEKREAACCGCGDKKHEVTAALHHWHDQLGLGLDGDRHTAVLEIAVMKPGDHAWQ